MRDSGQTTNVFVCLLRWLGLVSDGTPVLLSFFCLLRHDISLPLLQELRRQIIDIDNELCALDEANDEYVHIYVGITSSRLLHSSLYFPLRGHTQGDQGREGEATGHEKRSQQVQHQPQRGSVALHSYKNTPTCIHVHLFCCVLLLCLVHVQCTHTQTHSVMHTHTGNKVSASSGKAG